MRSVHKLEKGEWTAKWQVFEERGLKKNTASEESGMARCFVPIKKID